MVRILAGLGIALGLYELYQGYKQYGVGGIPLRLIGLQG
ncbi:unnamed protein product, partial [marine sediment metagenome]